MKRFLVAVGVIALALNGAWLFEGTNNNCAAIERLAMRTAAAKDNDTSIGAGLAFALMGQMNGTLAAAEAAKRYPGVPPSVSCNLAYWLNVIGLVEPVQNKPHN